MSSNAFRYLDDDTGVESNNNGNSTTDSKSEEKISVTVSVSVDGSDDSNWIVQSSKSKKASNTPSNAGSTNASGNNNGSMNNSNPKLSTPTFQNRPQQEHLKRKVIRYSRDDILRFQKPTVITETLKEMNDIMTENSLEPVAFHPLESEEIMKLWNTTPKEIGRGRGRGFRKVEEESPSWGDINIEDDGFDLSDMAAAALKFQSETLDLVGSVGPNTSAPDEMSLLIDEEEGAGEDEQELDLEEDNGPSDKDTIEVDMNLADISSSAALLTLPVDISSSLDADSSLRESTMKIISSSDDSLNETLDVIQEVLSAPDVASLYQENIVRPFDYFSVAAPAAPPVPLADEWFYCDLSNLVQGPFSASMMRNWHNSGYFTPELRIRMSHWSTFYPLSMVFPKFVDAFRFVPEEPMEERRRIQDMEKQRLFMVEEQRRKEAALLEEKRAAEKRAEEQHRLQVQAMQEERRMQHIHALQEEQRRLHQSQVLHEEQRRMHMQAMQDEQRRQHQLQDDQRRFQLQEERRQHMAQEEQRRQQQQIQEERRQQQLQEEQRRQQQMQEEQRRQQQMQEEQRRQQQMQEEQRRQQQMQEEQRRQQQMQEEQRRQHQQQLQEEQRRRMIEEQRYQEQLQEDRRRRDEAMAASSRNNVAPWAKKNEDISRSSLLEIQKQEAEIARVQQQQQQQMQQQQMQQSRLPWGSSNGGMNSKTLLEIQMEEEKVRNEERAQSASQLKSLLGVQSNRQQQQSGWSNNQKTSSPAPSLLSVMAQETQHGEHQGPREVSRTSSSWAAKLGTNGQVPSNMGGGMNVSSGPRSAALPTRVANPAPAGSNYPSVSKVPAEAYWGGSSSSSSSAVSAPSRVSIEGMPPDFVDWCALQIRRLGFQKDISDLKLAMDLPSSADIREFFSQWLSSTPQVSQFATDFIRRKDEIRKQRR